jgi:hypothetical protein
MIADAGHVWIHVYDTLPAAVRRRLCNSHYNVCPACLVTFVLPKVRSKHPQLSREKALLAGIEIMESGVPKTTVAVRSNSRPTKETHK